MNDRTVSELATPHGTLTIRPTHADDAAAFRDLRLEALRTHPEAFEADYADNLARPIAAWEDRVRSGAGDEHNITYVAAAGDLLAGMTGIFRHNEIKTRHSGTIWGVYVRPAWRGAGVADALIAACLAWGRAKGLRIVKLGVAATNTAAIRCYLRHSFAVYGIEPEVIYHDAVYYDELLMARRLAAPEVTARD